MLPPHNEMAGMHAGSYLNLTTADRNRFIYRIIPISRLYELFGNRENVLVSPRKWEDPFENAVLTAVFPRALLFGQCWTRHTASDAMWRIYSPKSKGVRMRTTVHALACSLIKALKGSNARAFIGGVRYLRDWEVIDFARRSLSENRLQAPAEQARTLLVKRWAFRHEREVRLVLIRAHDLRDEPLARYTVAPDTLIDELMLDPR